MVPCESCGRRPDGYEHAGYRGLEATRKIARSIVDTKVIMLTVHTENPLPAKVMQAGAAGYLSKGAAPQEVVNAIRCVASGQRYIASDIAQQMALSQIEPEKRNRRLPVCLNANCRLC